jgi:predicted adenine nucleotide alpha hydrolase (AANH) superfamily ATPase
MKLLLHICCAPCLIFPLNVLRQDGHDLTGCFYNPNIHPYLEYKKRLDTLKGYAILETLPVLYDETYPMEAFLQKVVPDEVAKMAKYNHYGGFTTTLLYSKYQKHELIKAAGEKAAAEYGVPFLYDDFRSGWSEGVKTSRRLGLYRQPYCGCIYSEKERYYGP